MRRPGGRWVRAPAGEFLSSVDNQGVFIAVKTRGVGPGSHRCGLTGTRAGLVRGSVPVTPPLSTGSGGAEGRVPEGGQWPEPGSQRLLRCRLRVSMRTWRSAAGRGGGEEAAGAGRWTWPGLAAPRLVRGWQGLAKGALRSGRPRGRGTVGPEPTTERKWRQLRGTLSPRPAACQCFVRAMETAGRPLLPPPHDPAG